MFFFFNDTATAEIYTLSLHDALPIYCAIRRRGDEARVLRHHAPRVAWLRRLHRAQPLLDLGRGQLDVQPRSEEHTSELQSQSNLVCRLLLERKTHQPTMG